MTEETRLTKLYVYTCLFNGIEIMIRFALKLIIAVKSPTCFYQDLKFYDDL